MKDPYILTGFTVFFAATACGFFLKDTLSFETIIGIIFVFFSGISFGWLSLVLTKIN